MLREVYAPRLLDFSLQIGQHALRGASERMVSPHVAQTHWWPHGTKACVLLASRHTQHFPPCSPARSSLELAAPPIAPLAPAPPAGPLLPAALTTPRRSFKEGVGGGLHAAVRGT